VCQQNVDDFALEVHSFLMKTGEPAEVAVLINGIVTALLRTED